MSEFKHYIFLIMLAVLVTSCESTFVVPAGSGSLSLNSLGVENYLQTSSLSTTKISGTCTQAEVTLSINERKQTLTCKDKKFSQTVNLTSLSDGDIKVSVSENKKGEKTVVSKTFIKDTVAPSTALLIQGMGAAFSKNYAPRSITFSATDDDYVVKYTRITSGTCASASFSDSKKLLANTAHQIRLLANSKNILCAIGGDRSGNWGTVVATSPEVVIDTRVPDLRFSLSRVEIESGTTYQVNWKLTEANPDPAEDMTLEYSETGSAPWTILDQRTVGSTALVNQSYSYSWASPSSVLGTGKMRLRLKDLTGEEGITEVPLILDNQAPTLDTLVLANGSPVVGISNVPVTVTVTKSLSEITEMRFSEDSGMAGATWAAYSASSLQHIAQLNGTHTLYAQVRSGSGQVSNILNADIELEHGDPPSISILAPVKGDTYGPGQSKTISWSCTTANTYGLATNPISITYTVDDGLTNHPVVSNLSSAVGTYSWTVPAMTPSGQVISISKPMRVNVYCTSAGGVVTNAISTVLNSSWDILVGEPGNILENVHVSVADITNGHFFGAADGSLYYAKQNGIMKMNPVTGIVNQWAASLGLSGCTFTHGGSGLLNSPFILDLSTSGEMLVYSEVCMKLYKVRLSDKRVLWSKNLTQTISFYFVSDSKTLFYFYDRAYYSLDISSSTHTPKLVIGTPGVCGTLGAVDTEARLSALPCGTGSGFSIASNTNNSKIWLYNSGTTPNSIQLELDETTGDYIRKDSTVGSNAFSRCVSVPSYPGKLFCFASATGGTSRTVAYFDLETGTRSATYSLPVFNNFSTNQLYLGRSPNSFYVTATSNEMFEVRYESGVWSSKHIGGTAFHTYGNGSDPSKVALTNVLGITYDPTNNWLYTRGSQHIRRFHINDTDPMDIHVDSIQTGMNSAQISNSGPTFGIAVNKTGTVLTNTSVSSNSRRWLSLQVSTWDALANSVVKGTSPNYYSTPTTSTAFPLITDVFITTAAYQLRMANYLPGTFLMDGNLYFLGSADEEELMDLRIFKSDGTNISTAVGAEGAVGYSSGDHGNLAQGARLTQVHGIQDDGAGDLLIFDSHRLRKATIGTESATPRIYDVTDFSQLTNYPGNLKWSHAIHDSNSGWSYFVLGEDQSINRSAKVWAARPAEGFVEIATSGITLSQTTLHSLQFEITPMGLVLLDGAKKRILVTPLKN